MLPKEVVVVVAGAQQSDPGSAVCRVCLGVVVHMQCCMWV